MRYLLVVGFACKIYQKKPQARIFFNNNLIDEYSIENNVDQFWGGFNSNRLDPTRIVKTHFKNIPLKLYELDLDGKKKDVELSIEIQNDDNNYSNGFLSSATFLQLRVFYLFPINDQLIKKIYNIYRYRPSTFALQWYYNQKQKLFDLTPTSKFTKKDGQLVSFNNFTNLGHSGTFTCTCKKKYGIFIPFLKKTFRFKINFFELEYLLNKYKQYENK